jgi:hypothetical protein
MQGEAKQLGAQIVEKEKQLSKAFGGGSLNEMDLISQTESLGLLYGKLRAVHLSAHIKIKPLLTPTPTLAPNGLKIEFTTSFDHTGTAKFTIQVDKPGLPQGVLETKLDMQ